MKATASIFAWVDISSSTPIRYQINDGHVDIILGTPASGIELTFDRVALKHFIDLASAALNTLPRPTFIGTAT